MKLPPLQPFDRVQTFVSGDVTIDPSAAIAPGVLMAAGANSRIIIGAGVCIGMGSILEAREGTLEIEAGAVLGAGVLVMGQVKIGANACIGCATTIFNSAIAPKQVVPPASLIGDSSRRIWETPPQQTAHNSASNSTPKKNTLPTIEILPYTNKVKEASVNRGKSDEPVFTSNHKPTTKESSAQPISPPPPTPSQPDSSQLTPAPAIYGQVHLNQLIGTLFPHKKSLNRPKQDGGAD